MDKILEFIMNESDNEVDLGEDDNDKSNIDSEWEFEEEEEVVETEIPEQTRTDSWLNNQEEDQDMQDDHQSSEDDEILSPPILPMRNSTLNLETTFSESDDDVASLLSPISDNNNDSDAHDNDDSVALHIIRRGTGVRRVRQRGGGAGVYARGGRHGGGVRTRGGRGDGGMQHRGGCGRGLRTRGGPTKL